MLNLSLVNIIIDVLAAKVEQLAKIETEPVVKESSIDMTALKEVFASKLHPDNTITRIERLENQLRDMQKKLERRDENIDLN
jgi:hypothetical protein